MSSEGPHRDWRVELPLLARAMARVDVLLKRLLDHYGLPRATDEEVDAVLEREAQGRPRRRDRP